MKWRLKYPNNLKNIYNNLRIFVFAEEEVDEVGMNGYCCVFASLDFKFFLS